MKTTNTFHLILLRIIFYVCAIYFFLMGAALIAVPHLVTHVAGRQSPIILGMLRGAGGSIVPYSLLYVLAANRPLQRRWAVYIIALANLIAIALDLISVFLGEYLFQYALLDIPIEVLSLFAIVLFIRRRKNL